MNTFKPQSYRAMMQEIDSSEDLSFNPFAGVDEHGQPVKRTRHTHPYSYDGFVQERCGENSEATSTVWTDRLLQWDYDLTRKLLKKHFADTGIDVGGDCWGSRSAAAIEGFLRERLGKPELRVILVMEYCNQATGYPVWRIDYRSP